MEEHTQVFHEYLRKCYDAAQPVLEFITDRYDATKEPERWVKGTTPEVTPIPISEVIGLLYGQMGSPMAVANVLIQAANTGHSFRLRTGVMCKIRLRDAQAAAQAATSQESAKCE